MSFLAQADVDRAISTWEGLFPLLVYYYFILLVFFSSSYLAETVYVHLNNITLNYSSFNFVFCDLIIKIKRPAFYSHIDTTFESKNQAARWRNDESTAKIKKKGENRERKSKNNNIKKIAFFFLHLFIPRFDHPKFERIDQDCLYFRKLCRRGW